MQFRCWARLRCRVMVRAAMARRARLALHMGHRKLRPLMVVHSRHHPMVHSKPPRLLAMLLPHQQAAMPVSRLLLLLPRKLKLPLVRDMAPSRPRQVPPITTPLTIPLLCLHNSQPLVHHKLVMASRPHRPAPTVNHRYLLRGLSLFTLCRLLLFHCCHPCHGLFDFHITCVRSPCLLRMYFADTDVCSVTRGLPYVVSAF